MINAKESKILLVIIAVVACFTTVSSADAQDYVLIAKASPVDGGVVSQSDADSGVVTLSASPQNGYQFVYWLGDVSDPTSQTTTALTDSPKLVIAVYERTDYPYQIDVAGAGGIMNTASRASKGAGGFPPQVTIAGSNSPLSGRSPSSYSYPEYSPQPSTDSLTQTDGVLATPEPSTLVLFAFAGLKLIRTRKQK